jgi:DNA-binding MarR family transcriptional regulator
MADLVAFDRFHCRLRWFLRLTREVARRNGVTALQYRLLLQIDAFPGREWSTVPELAERLQIKHHSVEALISRCETAGLVSYSATRGDERRVEVRLTPSGKRYLDCARRLHRDDLQVEASLFFVPGFGQDA